MKIVVTMLMLMAVVGFFYWLFKDAKFSSLDFRREKQKLDQEDKPTKDQEDKPTKDQD